ncbi:hypothetical protein [Burkholderia pseudomallei]|uniref:hypothetical protein n=1 Tax=Burkholderia pseudomallei TaxID=28450 RepID=UPI000F4DFAE1|nr:hypothetical protein [Burkholderia pseudomallei]RPE23007.1 hypothetical protein DF127_05660 [Burkholderia pseudomallei]RQS99006.1 hypothetical protein DF125_02810 [Burkholderia pseudomallei]
MASKDQMLPDLFANTRDSYGAISTRSNERLRKIMGAILLDTETGIESINSRGGWDARNVALYDVIDEGENVVALYQYRVARKQKASYYTEVSKTYYLAQIETNEHGVMVLTREVEVGEGFTSNKIHTSVRGGVSPLKRLMSEAYAETDEGRALQRYLAPKAPQPVCEDEPARSGADSVTE